MKIGKLLLLLLVSKKTVLFKRFMILLHFIEKEKSHSLTFTNWKKKHFYYAKIMCLFILQWKAHKDPYEFHFLCLINISNSTCLEIFKTMTTQFMAHHTL